MTISSLVWPTPTLLSHKPATGRPVDNLATPGGPGMMMWSRRPPPTTPQFSGTVGLGASDTPGAREVQLRLRDGTVLESMWSNASTGAFASTGWYPVRDDYELHVIGGGYVSESFPVTAPAGVQWNGNPLMNDSGDLDDASEHVWINTLSLDDVYEGESYPQTITCISAVGAVEWSVIAGALPSGLDLDGSTTSILGFDGTVSADGDYSFTIQVEDSLGRTATKAFTVTAHPAIAEYWSTTDKTSVTTLSNGTRDAEVVSPTAGEYGAVRGAVGRSGGLRYVEFEVLNDNNAFNSVVGVAKPSFVLPGAAGGFADAAVVARRFTTQYAVGTTSSSGTNDVTTGTRVGLLVNFEMRRCWMTFNGEWDAGGSPTTIPGGVNNVDIPAGVLYPFFSTQDSNAVLSSKVRLHLTQATMAHFPSAIDGCVEWAYPQETEPYISTVASLLHFNGVAANTNMVDQTGKTWTRLGSNTRELSATSVKFGSTSLRLAGTGSYNCIREDVTVGLFGSGFQSDFCTEFFVRLDAVTGTQCVWSQFGASPYAWGLCVISGQWQLHNSVGSTVHIAATGTATANTWHHVAITRDNGTVRLFVDGALLGSFTFTDTTGGTKTQYGCETNGGSPMTGYIDEARTSVGVIGSGASRYTSAFTPPTAPFPDP